MTKREYFMAIANIDAVKADADLSAFIAGEIEKLDKRKKAAKKPTAKQLANEELKKAIAIFLDNAGDKLYTVGELTVSVPECAGLSSQKVNALVKQLVDANILERTMIKRVAYFGLK